MEGLHRIGQGSRIEVAPSRHQPLDLLGDGAQSLDRIAKTALQSLDLLRHLDSVYSLAHCFVLTLGSQNESDNRPRPMILRSRFWRSSKSFGPST